MSNWKPVLEDMTYLPFSVDPLSADVAAIPGERFTWLFDVGSSPAALAAIGDLPGKLAVVISHFHADHSTNAARLQPACFYVGGYTAKKIDGTVVEQPMRVEDGRRFHLFPIPSTHAKGCIGLEVDELVAFIGDAAYATAKDGRVCYNATLLWDTIQCLEGLKAPWFFLSHAEPPLQKKEDVLVMLHGIYARRNAKDPLIYP